MTVEEIRSYRNAQPFHPFTLLLTSGKLLRVDRPSGIALAPDGQRLAVFEGNQLNRLRIEQVRDVAAVASEVR